MDRRPNKRPRFAWLLSMLWAFRDVTASLWRERLMGLVPVVLVLFILALLLAFLTAVSPIAPFVYPLF